MYDAKVVCLSGSVSEDPGIIAERKWNVDGHLMTTGQVARKLRVSVSTLKRWLDDTSDKVSDLRNVHGWRLFDHNDLEELRKYKMALKKRGRRFSMATLEPIVSSTEQNMEISAG